MTTPGLFQNHFSKNIVLQLHLLLAQDITFFNRSCKGKETFFSTKIADTQYGLKVQDPFMTYTTGGFGKLDTNGSVPSEFFPGVNCPRHNLQRGAVPLRGKSGVIQ